MFKMWIMHFINYFAAPSPAEVVDCDDSALPLDETVDPGDGLHDWVSAKNAHIKYGSVCMNCFAIHAKEPEDIEIIQGECPLVETVKNLYLKDCPLHNGKYYDWCVSCGELTEIPDPERHNPDNHYCGRSTRCCP